MKNTVNKRFFIRFTASLFAVLLVLASFVGCEREKEPEIWVPSDDLPLEVHFIDVGQGDSQLIITPTGDTILIDAGLPEAGYKVVKYLQDIGVGDIDLFVASHYDGDHIGGSHDVFNEFIIHAVLMLDCDKNTSTAKRFKTDVKSEGSEIIYAVRGYEFSYGNVEFLVMSPEKITDDGGNDDSIILRMEYGESSYLFTGDAEKKSERAAVDFYGADGLSSDVLKVGHHGSYTSSTSEFLNAVSPEIAVISCGKGNSYGHPHTSTMNRLKVKIKAENILRIDIMGTVVIMTDGKEIYRAQEY
ncbi:MAG: MBL fold metallo-hydrolase [Ruminococcaceae bacterium]|nr:MBL fold metallo-hydrolase [Oscillospiraceae bacterium]